MMRTCWRPATPSIHWYGFWEPVEVSGAGSSGPFDCCRRARGSVSLAEDSPDFHRPRTGGEELNFMRRPAKRRSLGPAAVGGAGFAARLLAPHAGGRLTTANLPV